MSVRFVTCGGGGRSEKVVEDQKDKKGAGHVTGGVGAVLQMRVRCAALGGSRATGRTPRVPIAASRAQHHGQSDRARALVERYSSRALISRAEAEAPLSIAQTPASGRRRFAYDAVPPLCLCSFLSRGHAFAFVGRRDGCRR